MDEHHGDDDVSPTHLGCCLYWQTDRPTDYFLFLICIYFLVALQQLKLLFCGRLVCLFVCLFWSCVQKLIEPQDNLKETVIWLFLFQQVAFVSDEVNRIIKEVSKYNLEEHLLITGNLVCAAPLVAMDTANRGWQMCNWVIYSCCALEINCRSSQ